MTHTTPPTPLLLPEFAFVVQFREGTDLVHRRVDGRVEHVVSGQATRFTSVEECVAFMARVLATVRAPPVAHDRRR